MYQGLIFICAFNCETYIAACIRSLKKQTDQNFFIVLIDDASTDNTANVAQQMLSEIFPGRYRFIRNPINLGKAANAYLHLKGFESTYTAILDGDDQLIDDSILQVFSDEYNNNYDIVYSTYRTTDGRIGHCSALNPTTSPRTQGWRSSHFFSFRSHLIKNVPIDYFQTADQEWIKSACDFAIAFPLLDQTRRYKFIQRQAYLYTSNSPNNHHNKKGISQSLSSPEQQENAAMILKKPPLPCIHPIEGSGIPFERFMIEQTTNLEQQINKVLFHQNSSIENHLDNAAIMKLALAEEIPLSWLQHSGGWAIEYRVYEYLIHLMNQIENPSILEFGSGLGSKILHKMALRRGGSCTSVEHSLEWHKRSLSELKQHNLARENSIAYSPLIDINVFGIDTKFYDLSWLSGEHKFDIVIVDGPPQTTSPLSRLAAFPLISGNLNSKFHIILDDFDRPAEKKIVEIWKTVIPELNYEEIKFRKSICLISPPHIDVTPLA